MVVGYVACCRWASLLLAVEVQESVVQALAVLTGESAAAFSLMGAKAVGAETLSLGELHSFRYLFLEE